MSIVQYQCAMSLDGFIAGPGGDMQWMNGLDEVPTSLADGLAQATGAILSGARTHRGDDPNAGTDSAGAYGGTYLGGVVVLTHHPDDPAPEGVEFSDDLHAAVARAQELAGDLTVAVFGADVARQCIEAGLLDELLVFVEPIMLGDGVRLFDWPGGRTVRLEVLRADGLALHARIIR